MVDNKHEERVVLLQTNGSASSSERDDVRSENRALWILLLSSALFSVMAVFVKLASQSGIASSQLVFCRAAFQMFFVVLGMVFLRENNSKTNKQNDVVRSRRRRRLVAVPFGDASQRGVVVARGAVGGLGFVVYYFTISSIPLGDAIALLSLAPVITVFLARFTIGEPVTRLQIAATVLTVVGAAMVAESKNDSSSWSPHDENTVAAGDGGDGSGLNYNSVGYVTAVCGSFLNACILVLVRRSGSLGVHTLQLLFSWCFFGLSISSVLETLKRFDASLDLFRQRDWHLPTDATQWWYVTAVCSFGSAAHFLMNYAGRLAPAGTSSIVRSSTILWGYVFEVAVFHQRPRATTWVGVCVLLFSLLLIAWEKLSAYLFWNKQQQQQQQQQQQGDEETKRILATKDADDANDDDDNGPTLTSNHSYGSFAPLSSMA